MNSQKNTSYNSEQTEKQPEQTGKEREQAGKRQIEGNKMGYMPVPRLLFSMAVPMMISMMVQALYNVVDSIFVAQLSEDALTSVSLAFPMQNLMIAVGSGIGVGTNALLSKKLGEKDNETASSSAVHGIFLSVIAYIIFALFGIFLTRTFFQGQTDIKVIIDGGVEYLTIICVVSFGLFGQIILERLLQSTGKTIYSMITQGTGAIINIILDPILIFGLFGMPKLGIRGAAIATVIGQIVASCLALYFNISKNKEISLSFHGFHPRGNIIGRILYVGVPSIIMVAVTSVTVFGLNRILMQFSSTAAAVLGAYFKLQSFIMMPVFGLNSGMIPIIAFNYGAKNGDRIGQTIKLSVITAMIIMALGMALLHIFPAQLLMLFNASDHMLSIGVPALKTISLSFIFAGYCIVLSSVFQAFGKGILSMIVSLMRQLVVLLPAAYLLAKTGEVNNVWWAYPLAEVMSLILSTLFLIRIHKSLISKL